MTDNAKAKTLYYKRSHFVTQLPLDYLYSPSHGWLQRLEGDRWRVGLTKFATRMLGDMVDCGFDLKQDTPIAPGDVVGWIEGFKAISDIFGVVDGAFLRANPDLKQDINVISKAPYDGGWLYEVRGTPDARCMDVQAYQSLLDVTIDRILEKQKGDDTP